MIGSKSLIVALVSGGLGAAGLQIVHAANAVRPAGMPSVQKLDDDSYPHMRRALRDLHTAKDSLKDAEPRFKGHRDKAIEHVNEAIQQCEDALAEG
ncbi:MAG TPA: hypothetical protein VHX86_12290 [Tepidisphaeraceae bacterium]|jgi:hypothetical protein|nr:hypothetical protein [Tepidisphaeraceae bacterium]